MRILQIIQKRQLRGAEIFACQLSEHLVSKGFHVDVAYLFDDRTSQLSFDLNFISLNGNQKKRFRDLRTYRYLAGIIRDGGYDIVQANAGDTLKYAVLSKVIYGWSAKLVFRNANRMSGFIKSRIHLLFNKWLLSRCDFIISVSEDSRQDLIRLHRPASSCSTTIPVGTEPVVNTQSVPRGLSPNEPIFISIGSFVAEKNHLFLLDVFYRYWQQFGIGALWLVGDGKLRSELEEKVRELNIKDRVHFWGYRADRLAILKSADIFLMPSLVEGLPAVILEAMACHVPVIASAVGGIPEVVKNGVTGICISEMIADHYVSGICALMSDDGYRRRLVDAAKTMLLEKFTLEKVALDFEIQYKKLRSV